ncbi:unnamed protein product [Brassica rapa]|uniref:Uncharacterized protein n=1 Tax=Brassica campestris TaxID=3711 RepID=A0A8D9LPJ1_BRACM|nr:unnamed protein product [Brassica rapa]
MQQRMTDAAKDDRYGSSFSKVFLCSKCEAGEAPEAGQREDNLSTMFLCPWVENRDNGNDDDDDDDKKDEYGNTQPFP